MTPRSPCPVGQYAAVRDPAGNVGSCSSTGRPAREDVHSGHMDFVAGPDGVTFAVVGAMSRSKRLDTVLHLIQA